MCKRSDHEWYGCSCDILAQLRFSPRISEGTVCCYTCNIKRLLRKGEINHNHCDIFLTLICTVLRLSKDRVPVVAFLKKLANPVVGFRLRRTSSMAGRPFRSLQFNLWWRFLQIFSLFQSYEKIQLLRAGLKKKKKRKKKKPQPHNPPKTLFIDLS